MPELILNVESYDEEFTIAHVPLSKIEEFRAMYPSLPPKSEYIGILSPDSILNMTGEECKTEYWRLCSATKHWQISVLEIEPLANTWRDFTLKDSAHVGMFYIKRFDFIF